MPLLLLLLRLLLPLRLHWGAIKAGCASRTGLTLIQLRVCAHITRVWSASCHIRSFSRFRHRLLAVDGRCGGACLRAAHSRCLSGRQQRILRQAPLQGCVQVVDNELQLLQLPPQLCLFSLPRLLPTAAVRETWS